MSPAVELAASVDPTGLIDALTGAVDDAVAAASAVALLPAQGLVDASTAAKNVSNQFYTALYNATDNVVLQNLVALAQATSQTNLGRLVDTAEALQSSSEYWVDDIGTYIVADALNTAIEYMFTAVADVINNPLALTSWAGLASAAVYSGFNAADDAVFLVNDLIQAPLDLLDTAFAGDNWSSGITGYAYAAGKGIADWSTTTSYMLSYLATSTGSPLIEGLTQALLAVTTTPLSLLADGLADASYWTPVYTAVIAPQQITYAVANFLGTGLYNAGSSIANAIDTIAADPLSPAAYSASLQTMVTAAFNTGDQGIYGINDIAQSLPWITESVVNGGEDIVNAVVNAAGFSASGLLFAAGLTDAAQVPIDIAQNITAIVTNAATAVTNATGAASTWLNETADQLVSMNDALGTEINNLINGVVPASAAAAGPAASGAPKPASALVADTSGTDETEAAHATVRSSVPGGHRLAAAGTGSSAKGGSTATPASGDAGKRAHRHGSVGSAKSATSHTAGATGASKRARGAA